MRKFVKKAKTSLFIFIIMMSSSSAIFAANVTDTSKQSYLLGDFPSESVELISDTTDELIPITNTVEKASQEDTSQTNAEFMNPLDITFEETYVLSNNSLDYSNDNADASENQRDNETNPQNELVSDNELPDLVLVDFYTSINEPFPTNEYIPFYVKIENHGTAYAYPITLDILINGTRYSSATYNDGGLNPNQGVVAKVELGTMVGGTYKITAIVNDKHKILESNYDNNTFEKSFRWVTIKSGISMLYFEPTSGSFETVVDTPTQFDFAIANWGPNDIDDNGIPIAFIVNDTIQGQFYAKGPIPVGKARKGSVILGFHAPGRANVGLLVDPDKTFSDSDRSDNLITHLMVISQIQASNRLSTNDHGTITMFAEGHGITTFKYDLEYEEDYAVMPNDFRRYTYHRQYATLESMRRIEDTPYEASMSPIYHVNKYANGNQSVTTLETLNEAAIWPGTPSGPYYFFAAVKSNNQSRDIPLNTDAEYIGHFNITVRTDNTSKPIFTNEQNRDISMSLTS